MDYSKLIKALRKSMILSQEEFAKYLGVSFATVNRWERGHHEPTYAAKRKIMGLCKEHNINMSENMGDAENDK